MNKNYIDIDCAVNIHPNDTTKILQKNNIKLNISAPGLSTRSIGDLIEFKLPTNFLEDRDGWTPSENHLHLSGYYLITRLRHHFTADKYQIEFEAIKDSLRTPVGIEPTADELVLSGNETI